MGKKPRQPEKDGNSYDEQSSKIKDIVIQLHEYKFFHSPSGITRKDDRLIGRERVKKKLGLILRNSKTRSGAYLITGYRGMGKTSLVREVISRLKRHTGRGPYFITTGLALVLSLLIWASVIALAFAFHPDRFFDGWQAFFKENLWIGCWVASGAMFVHFIQLTMAWVFNVKFNPKFDSLEDGSNKTDGAGTVSPRIKLVLWIRRKWNNPKEWQERYWRSIIPRCEHYHTIDLEFSLSQEDLKDLDILRLLGKKLCTRYIAFRKPFYSYNNFLAYFSKIGFYLILSCIGYCMAYHYWFNVLPSSTYKTQRNELTVGEPQQDRGKSDPLAEVSLGEFLQGVSNNDPRIQSYLDRLSSPELEDRVVAPAREAESEGKAAAWKAAFDKRKATIPFLALCSIVAFFLSQYISRTTLKLAGVLGIRTHYSIIKRLKRLVIQINANITMEQSKGTSANPGTVAIFGLGSREVKQYPIAGSKEVELRIIELLDDIDSLNFLPISKAKFIFVFDELDKIQPHFNPALSDKEAENPYLYSDSNNPEFNSARQVRERQEAISQILANLKHFLNVAKAKFVFIAGREMFDASLADISDRDSFLGSIFHEIFYVESFLKDKSNPLAGGVTNMAETYLCSFLIPQRYQLTSHKTKQEGERYPLSLKGYANYLKEIVYPEEFERRFGNKYKSISDPDIKKDIVKRSQEDQDEIQAFLSKADKSIFKTLVTLQNFVIFLVYRSNGTPKKITSLFEKYVEGGYQAREELNQRDIFIPLPNSCKGRKDALDSMVLRFSFKTQYQFGLITYLFRPYLIANSRYIKSFGDKLLFSTAFLVDHLFKFHPWAFSWRTLELTPELISSNKSPELRNFIEELVGLLLNTHLREITYGVFRFKFYNKIRQEISFISKISEGESAAFNFTLDESLLIKQHYRKKLHSLLRDYREHPSRQRGDYIHSLGFMHSTLGDLHFYDQEYTEAIMEYSEAIALVGAWGDKPLTPHQLTNWFKDRLKMALTYEKMKAHDDALSLYEGIIQDILKVIMKVTDENKPDEIARYPDAFKSLFENLRFLQLPFVAQLALIEKESISGISYMDIKINEDRLNRIIEETLVNDSHGQKDVLMAIPESQEFLVRTYYHMNIASLLYFKNGAVLHANKELKKNDKALSDRITEGLRWDYGKKPTDTRNPHSLRKESLRYKIPRSAAIEYYKSFVHLYARMRAFGPSRGTLDTNPSPKFHELEKDTQTAIEEYFWARRGGKRLNIHESMLAGSIQFLFFSSRSLRFVNKDAGLLSTVGLLLSKMGDISINYISESTEMEFEGWKSILGLDLVLGKESEEAHYLEILRGDHLKNPILRTAFFYLLSAIYYLEAGKTFTFEFQLRKILYLVKEWLSFGIEKDQVEKGKAFRDLLRDKTVRPALKAMTWANDVTNRPQIFKYKSILGIEGETNRYEGKNIYTHISNNPESKELVLLMAEIELKLVQKGCMVHEDLPFNFDSNIIGPYASISSRFVRLLELNFKVQWNLHEFKRLGATTLNGLKELFFERAKETIENYPASDEAVLRVYLKINDSPEDDHCEQAMIEHLISDSIFCLHELIKSLNIFGINYMTNHTYLAYTHMKMGDWSLLFREYISNVKLGFPIKKKRESITKLENDRTDLEKKISQVGGKLKYLTNSMKNCSLIDHIKRIEEYMSSEKRAEEGILPLINKLKEELKDVDHSNPLQAPKRSNWKNYVKALEDWKEIQECKERPLQDFHDPNDPELIRITNFIDRIEMLINEGSLDYLDPKYHYELAVNHFYSAIEMNNGGRAYTRQLKNMYFLEDDFNDSLYHFCAALERYKINTGEVENQIKALRSIMDLSKTYAFESYVNTAVFGREENAEAAPEGTAPQN